MIRLVDNYKAANCITHNGNFHADDIFATALMHLIKKDINVMRITEVNWEEVEPNTIVYDIGRREFDHHQSDAEIRDNKIPYSSIGLLWREFGKKYLEDNNYDNIDLIFNGVDKDLIEGIDADDNGVFPKIDANYKVKTISNIIKLFNPGYHSFEDVNTQFIKAVEVAEKILIEEIIYIKGKVEADLKIKEILDNINPEDEYILLDEFIPYEDTIISSEKGSNIKFVAYPSNRGGYAIKTVPVGSNDKSSRLPLPEQWAGKNNEELEEVTNIKGTKFCHNARFIMTCETLEAVKSVLEVLCKKV